MFRGIFHKKRFTREQSIQMRSIEQAYRTTILASDQAFPHTLSLRPEKKGGKDKAMLLVSANSYNFSTWLPRLGNSSLRTYAEDMLRIVCAYQSERMSRNWWNSGYSDEPIQLACEELKETFVVKISQDRPSDGLLKIVKNRIEYLDYLLGVNEFLPSYSACRESADVFRLTEESMTFYRVLLEIKNILTTWVKPLVEAEVANSCARDDLRPLIISYRQMVQHSIGYLFYILNPVAMPSDFTFDNIRRADTKGYENFLETTAGKYLKQLVALQHSFSEMQLIKINESVLERSEQYSIEGYRNPFAELKEFSLKRRFQNGNHGVHQHFINSDNGVMTLFVSLHKLLAEIINLSGVWELAYKISGEGGDILIYGFQNSNINILLNKTEDVIQMLQSMLVTFHLEVYEYFITLCRANTLVEKEHKGWVDNFRFSQMYYTQFISDLAACSKRILLIRNKANSVTLEERLFQAESQFNRLRSLLDCYLPKLDNLLKEAESSSINRSMLPIASAESQRERRERNVSSVFASIDELSVRTPSIFSGERDDSVQAISFQEESQEQKKIRSRPGVALFENYTRKEIYVPAVHIEEEVEGQEILAESSTDPITIVEKISESSNPVSSYESSEVRAEERIILSSVKPVVDVSSEEEVRLAETPTTLTVEKKAGKKRPGQSLFEGRVKIPLSTDSGQPLTASFM